MDEKLRTLSDAEIVSQRAVTRRTLLSTLGIVAIAMAAYVVTRGLRPDAGVGAPKRRDDKTPDNWAVRRSSMRPPAP